MDSMSSTFVAALRSVGTAATMAAAGFYLHRRKFITGSEKKALARMSQQVTIPALFFTKIIYCPQDFSQEKCPNITDSLGDIWVLLLWPLFVVGCGLAVGEVACRLSSTPRWQRKSVIAACAFPNSTGIPITLLTVIHSNFPATTEIGRVDPNLFLSVYLVLYPIMQWGVGGWLLSSGEENTDTSMKLTSNSLKTAHDSSDDVLYQEAASNMIKELSLSDLLEAKRRPQTDAEEARLLPPPESVPLVAFSDISNDVAPLMETVVKALPKALQPPVIGALLGLIIAAVVPLRGLFVDLHGRADRAPLEWMFDGLYSVRRIVINETL
jgi:predicted permease